MTTPIIQDTPRHARQALSVQVQRLAVDAAAAAEVRTWQTHPDVVALRVERIRAQVDRLMWTGIVLGLCFTMTNVQQFAAAGAPMGSLAWWSAWLLDPMVSLVLLAVLRAEQVITRYQMNTGLWPRVVKWALLAATYVMNTWVSWAAGSAAGVVLHSVPPLVVVIAAEAVTDVQYALTECVHRAHTIAVRRVEQMRTAGDTGVGEQHASASGGRSVNTSAERFVSPANERAQQRSVNPGLPVQERVARPVADARHKRRSRPPMRRKLLADYLAEARAAWTPDQVVTPAWVRQVTRCSRGLSSKVAAALNADLPQGQHTTIRTEPPGRAA
jgi:hypothetical protein